MKWSRRWSRASSPPAKRISLAALRPKIVWIVLTGKRVLLVERVNLLWHEECRNIVAAAITEGQKGRIVLRANSDNSELVKLAFGLRKGDLQRVLGFFAPAPQQS